MHIESTRLLRTTVARHSHNGETPADVSAFCSRTAQVMRRRYGAGTRVRCQRKQWQAGSSGLNDWNDHRLHTHTHSTLYSVWVMRLHELTVYTTVQVVAEGYNKVMYSATCPTVSLSRIRRIWRARSNSRATGGIFRPVILLKDSCVLNALSRSFLEIMGLTPLSV